MADAGGTHATESGLVRGLGLLDATALIVGSVIGSGIFFAPSYMAGMIETPILLLGLWWGYPTHPVLYILVSSFFLICIPVANPVYSGRGIVLTLLGIPAYVYWRRASP